jgi:hypothetical protein
VKISRSEKQMTMAESNGEKIAKSGENPKENGVKMKESHKGSSFTNGKHNGDAVKNGGGEENSKLIISQKSTPTHSHKSLHTPIQASGCTTEASSNINHVAPKTDSKSKSEAKSSSERDKKRRDEHGKDNFTAIYSRAPRKSGEKLKTLDDS